MSRPPALTVGDDVLIVPLQKCVSTTESHERISYGIGHPFLLCLRDAEDIVPYELNNTTKKPSPLDGERSEFLKKFRVTAPTAQAGLSIKALFVGFDIHLLQSRGWQP